MPLVQEFLVRKHLADIGVDDAALGTMPWAKALQLAGVAAEIESIKGEEMAKSRKKR